MAWKMAAFLLVWALAVSAITARAKEEQVRPTPEEMRALINRIVQSSEESARPLADKVVYDGDGGFAFRTARGDSQLRSGEAGVQISGVVDGSGRIEQTELFMCPIVEFNRAFVRTADRIVRAYLIGSFGTLSRMELETLLAAYWFAIAPYHYKEGDTGVTDSSHTYELELAGEVARFESEFMNENELCLHVIYVQDADDERREAARQNGWSARRFGLVVLDCTMIETCGECLADIGREELPGKLADAEAIIAQCEEKTAAIRNADGKRMQLWLEFVQDVQEQCALLDGHLRDFRAAIDAEDMDAAWLCLQQITAAAAYIGEMPQMLYQ